MMKRYMISVSEEMAKRLEEERKKRLLDSVPETIRVLLSEYLSEKS
jgi:metal-responsive CopG/Arc/MetJ family transcriptional regulator